MEKGIELSYLVNWRMFVGSKSSGFVFVFIKRVLISGRYF